MPPPSQTSAEEANPDRTSTGSFSSTLAAPWHFLHPARAAKDMAAGSRGAFWASLQLGATVIAAMLIGLVMWHDAVTGYWAQQEGHADVVGLLNVWRTWHKESWFGPAEVMLLSIWSLTPLLVAMGAWLLLPNVHQGGAGLRSYRRAFRGVGAGIGVLAIFVLVIGFPITAMTNAVDTGAGPGPEIVFPFVVFCVSCGCALVFWLHRATAALREGRDTGLALPPLCEGCGYDLTHRPGDGRCPECGLGLTASLTPVDRPGCQWQICQDIRAWAITTASAIVGPGQFYRRLQLRTDAQPAKRFALWQYLSLGLYAACACGLAILAISIRFGGEPPGFICFLPFMFMFLIPLICWMVHHVVGAAATSWFIVRDALPDAGWSRTVMDFETAYLWTFCLYSSALILSFTFFDDWMSEIAGTMMLYSIGGTPIEFFAVFFGNIVLGLLWFWRYRIAFLNIRWSNF